MNLLGVIFTFDSCDITNKMFCDRYYIVTFVTENKIYYKRLYAQIYHPSWESKPLSKSYDSTILVDIDTNRTKYVLNTMKI